MNKLILCEGTTDAVLLSYYLEAVGDWKFIRKPPMGLDIKAIEENETANWYKRANDYLLICAVGGKDNFKRFYENRIKAPLLHSDAFEKIAIVIDRDQREVENIENFIESSLSGINERIKNNFWVSGKYRDAFKMEKEISILLLIIPEEHQGALETLMLEAISEDPYDKNVVDNASIFVKKMRKEAGKYLSSNRLQLKAHLGVSWAIKYPEKTFSLIDEEIRDVHWENSEILKRCFSKLVEI